MDVSLACVAIVLVLNYVVKVPVAIAMGRQKGGYDNRNPREQQARLEGWGRRAVAAHANGFEAFAPFAAAVLAAHVTHAPLASVNALAITFVIARVAYAALYIANVATLRSLVWGVGFFATLGLFGLAIFR